MAKVIIEIKNTASEVKGLRLRASIDVDHSAELDGDERTLAGLVALLVLEKSRDIVQVSANEAIEILKNDGVITGGDVTETTVEETRH
ncbi:hypothetical protein GBF45_18525 [Salmonella enterica subsp. enterica]|nr:hypothetical protein [Salmonella enterica subsp. enterica serovar Enteritidis]EDE9841411.1 hypothetical protein [Salmonella enterica subsp. enterica serovar Ealing]EHE7523736.1 hypothetical protein [Salmonella enterica subsp. enterica serovar Isangi]EID1929872.1 hypothetical protein [Salmonella enterica]HAF1541370.1 hypothetical protein [Salmonella enterica]